MFPALRLAYVVLPADLVDPFVVARGLADGHPPSTTQRALADFITEGHFGAHVRRMRGIYRARRDALADAFERHLPRVQLGSTEGGLRAVALLDPDADDGAVSRSLLKQGIDAQPLSRFYSGEIPRPGLFIGYGALAPLEIRDGVSAMAGSGLF